MAALRASLERGARTERDSDSDRVEEVRDQRGRGRRPGAVHHRGVHPGRARRPAGGGAAPALPGAAQDRAGREDSRPGEPAAARRAGAPGAGRAAADPVSRGVRLLRAGSGQRAVGPAEDVGRRGPARRRRVPRAGRWNSGRSAANGAQPMPDIDDPFKPADATVLRPRPGAGTAQAQADVPAPPRWQSPSRHLRGAAAVCGARGARHRAEPARAAASPLLLLAGQLRGTLSVPDVGGLRRHALDEIRRFEERARAAGVANEAVLAARYALCAALDEAVLSTPWGAQSEWAQQTLLVALHREAWGGEKFFEMLDRISQRSGAPHRPDGAAVSLPRRRLRRQVPGRSSAGTRGWPTCSRTSTAGSATIAARRRRSCRCAGGARGPPQPAHPLRAVVGRRRRGAGDPGDRLRRLLRAAGQRGRAGAGRAREGGARGLQRRPSTAAIGRPDAEAAAGAGGGARRGAASKSRAAARSSRCSRATCSRRAARR